MVNSIKQSADGLALQITKPAREAGLVVEDSDGTATRRAEVYVYGFDDLLLLVDTKHVAVNHRAELVSTAASDSESIYRGAKATVEIAGNGYQVQLPGCTDAGFTHGDPAPVTVGDGILVIHNRDSSRLTNDLITIRNQQVSS